MKVQFSRNHKDLYRGKTMAALTITAVVKRIPGLGFKAIDIDNVLNSTYNEISCMYLKDEHKIVYSKSPMRAGGNYYSLNVGGLVRAINEAIRRRK